ncbi:DUF1289 domain-containing protein [Marivibrio halodurans]|uniref:DUF1289 domain-containing protein n=1 Tax=Marivibrio halodurans TaxID=2039722 RepID=A0A8J7S129_9PROT|nr:DUF1289 domain-containing protein [Marivibrio halodurans]MBP5858305.1 DUF1289 domain-containing protein [Marivibrio halodurans]
MTRQPLPDIPSPCVGICALDGAAERCVGCLRTRAEIMEWSRATNERKLAIVQAIKQRRIDSGRVSWNDLRPRRRRRRGEPPLGE